MQAATVAVDLLLALPAASTDVAASRALGETFEAPESGSDGEVAPLELPPPSVVSSTPCAGSVIRHSRDVHEAELVSCTPDVDFSTTALDELLETVACEGPPPGQPITSAMGLKATLSTPPGGRYPASTSGKNGDMDHIDASSTEHRSRVRRRVH